MTRIHHLVFLLFSFLISLSVAANSPTSFCKCICLTNSTIISLTPKPGVTDLCSICNRSFCAGYRLPICKDIEEAQIKTDCFQRDSAKDRVIVWAFMLGTMGLLGWAGLRRLVEANKGAAGGWLNGVMGGGRGTRLFGRVRGGGQAAAGAAYSPLDEPRAGEGRGAG
ncbi:hypothetical protein QBC34DRAFT_438076 [Podospora aff. communis PSN243]|uniref:Uncharacterized protein n=1 Tax=Podospora aff. communis PSN243 TaxID=3040156 RepID=A0AAV9GNX0_9PEZI|nr:hypothetical protein QBC34DRAFT_438076 [Podospora aff. communis PSN243]